MQRLFVCSCLAVACSSSPPGGAVDGAVAEGGVTSESSAEATAGDQGDADTELDVAGDGAKPVEDAQGASDAAPGDSGGAPTCALGTASGVVCSIATYCVQCMNGVLWGCICVTTSPVPQGTPYHWYCASQNQACSTSPDSG